MPPVAERQEFYKKGRERDLIYIIHTFIYVNQKIQDVKGDKKKLQCGV